MVDGRIDVEMVSVMVSNSLVVRGKKLVSGLHKKFIVPF